MFHCVPPALERVTRSHMLNKRCRTLKHHTCKARKDWGRTELKPSLMDIEQRMLFMLQSNQML